MQHDLPNRLIFFDGLCVICNKFVDFLVVRDTKALFKYAALQSQSAKSLLPTPGVSGTRGKPPTSIVYLQGGETRVKSDAILSIIVDLGGAYRTISLFFLVPRQIRDWAYDQFAKRRYGWFGKTPVCRIPTQKELQRFLD